MKKNILLPLLFVLSLSLKAQEPGKCINGNCSNGEGTFLLTSGDTLYTRFKNDKPMSFGEIHFKNGNIYIGYIYKSLPNGTGRMIYKDKSEYNGFWQDGKRESSGSMKYPDGTKIYGKFQNDLLVGPAAMKTGCLAGTCIEGQGSYVYADGSKYNGNFWGTLKQGKGNFEFRNGDVYMGEWVLDTIQGYGTMRYPTGDYYEGSFEKGVRTGYGSFYNALTKLKQTGIWENNVLIKEAVVPEENNCIKGDCQNGKSTITYGSFTNCPGCNYEGNLVDGEKNGYGSLTTIEGIQKTGYWQNDILVRTDTTSNQCNFGDCVNGYGLYDWPSKEYYSGFWRNDRRSFYGVNHFKTGNKYSGFWKADKKAGFGIQDYVNGEQYIGYFKNDYRNGNGEFLFENGNRFVGEFINDTINGEGIMYYPDGKIERGFWRGARLVRLKENDYGCISGDCWYGYGSYISKHADRYIGEWLDSRYNGNGLLYESNGNIYVGEFKDGAKEGYGKQFWANGERYIGYWKNNMIDGQGVYIYRNDSLLNAHWREGKFVVKIPDNPDVPRIIWETPLTAQTVTYSNKFKIKLGIISATKLSNAQIFINEKLFSNFAQYDTAEVRLAEFDYTIEKEIKLKEGDNIVKIVAVNDYGEETSVLKTIRYKPNAFMEKQALLVANNYNDKKYDYFVENGKKLEQILTAENYKVRLLINPSAEEFEQAIREFGQDLLANQTNSCFYFGGLIKQLDAKNYFIITKDSICTQDEVVANGFEINRLYAELQYGGAVENNIILDYFIPQYYDPLFRLNGEWGLFPSLPPLNTRVYFSSMPGSETGKSVVPNLFMTSFLTDLATQHDFKLAFKVAKDKVEATTNKMQIPFYFENNSKY